MKKNSILVNTARGRIIKDLELLKNYLLKNKNFCVGLDASDRTAFIKR